MKLLIVEDNQLLAASLKNLLKPSYIVDLAYTGAHGLELAKSTQYSIILLDLNLPDMNGHKVCLHLREAGIATPILVATGDKESERCVQMLDGGADDYITKPYNASVLQARIRALLRRSSTPAPKNTLTVGDLTIHRDTRRVERAGTPIRLRKKEFDILEYLARNQGRPMSRQMILNHVWEAGKEGWNNTIDVHIKYLRDKVDKPFSTRLIKTAHGIGYMVDNTE